MKLAIFSFLLVGVVVAAPAGPAWKFTRGDFNDTNATAPNAHQMYARGSGHANLPKLPAWNRRFENITANPNGHVARNANLTLPVSVTIKERAKEMSAKREANFPKFGVY